MFGRPVIELLSFKTLTLFGLENPMYMYIVDSYLLYSIDYTIGGGGERMDEGWEVFA